MKQLVLLTCFLITLSSQAITRYVTLTGGGSTGTINSNPLFTNIALGTGTDGNWLTNDDGLRLQNLSPYIDVGNNPGVSATDILSNNRITNFTVDMGAYEYNSVTMGITIHNEEENNILVFPNPSNGSISIKGLQNENGKIRILNNLGVLVKEFTLSSEHLDISGLACGFYSVLIATEKQIITKQFIIAE